MYGAASHSTPYPQLTRTFPSEPIITARPQPQTPYSAAITPDRKLVNQWTTNLQHSDEYLLSFSTNSTIGLPYTSFARLAKLVSGLTRIDITRRVWPLQRAWGTQISATDHWTMGMLCTLESRRACERPARIVERIAWTGQGRSVSQN